MKNVGGIDRVLRIVLGAVLVALTVLGYIGPFGWLGLVLLASGVFSKCYLYKLIGMNTCSIKQVRG